MKSSSLFLFGILSLFLCSHSKANNQVLPDFFELSDTASAIVGRICLNQVLRIPPTEQNSITPDVEDKVLNCMINYRQLFSSEQLKIVKSVLEYR